MAFLQAKDVKLPSDLTDVLGSIGTPRQSAIGDIYGRMRGQFGQDVRRRGMRQPLPGGYADQRLTQGQNTSNLGLRSSLEDVLGNTGYNDYKAQREYEQNMELAKRVGALNAPSVLQQVLGGLNGAVNAGSTGYALFDKFRNRPTQQTGPSLSLYNPNAGSEYSYYMG